MDYSLVGLIFVAATCICLNTALARKKGYPAFVGLLIGLLLPLWGLLIILLIPDRNKREHGASSLSAREGARMVAGSAALGVALTAAGVALVYIVLFFMHLSKY